MPIYSYSPFFADPALGSAVLGGTASDPWGLAAGRNLAVVNDAGTARVNIVGSAAATLAFGSSTVRRGYVAGGADSSLLFGVNPTNSGVITAECARFAPSGRLLLGSTVDGANGRLQLATHSTFADGIAFGTDASGYNSIWSSAAQKLRTYGSFEAGALRTGVTPATLGVRVMAVGGGATFGVGFYDEDALDYARIHSPRTLAWGNPSGTLTRSGFNTGTVTLSALAERVAALINDLRDGGGYHAILKG